MTAEDCPHDLPGRAVVAGLRRARPGEEPTHVSECPRCETKLYAVHEPSST